MARIALVFACVGGLICLIAIVGVWIDHRTKRNEIMGEERKMLPSKTATDMARLLETGLADPLYRQSSDWEDRARALVRNHYGDNR